MEKKVVKMFQKIHIELYKTRGGGGSKAVYKLYKKNRQFGIGWLPLLQYMVLPLLSSLFHYILLTHSHFVCEDPYIVEQA